MHRGDKIYVAGAFILKLDKYIGKPVNAYVDTLTATAYLAVLAVDTAERAVRKENRSGALLLAYAWLFPFMERGPCNPKCTARTAIAELADCAVGFALSGAEGAR